jgi:hypothetical protein
VRAVSEALPALRAYLDGLPHGLDSYPEHAAKGSLVRAFAAHPSLLAATDVLPAPIVALMQEPPSASSWVREVHHTVLLVALQDLVGAAIAIDFVRRCVRETLASPLYRALIVLVGPARMISAAGVQFGQFHRGLSVRSTPAPSGARTRPRTVPGLVTPFVAECYAASFAVAVELSGAKNVRCTVARFTPTEIEFAFEWR